MRREFVEFSQFFHPGTGKRFVTVFHFRDCPAQGNGNFFRIVDDGSDEVRKFLVVLKFHDFGVNHDKFQIIGVEIEKQAHNERVHTDGLTRTGRTGNQQMGCFGKVQHHGFVGNVFPEDDRDLHFALFPCRSFHDCPHEDGFALGIGDFHAHHISAGDRGKNTDGRSRKRHGDIAGNLSDLFYADAFDQTDFITGDTGAGDVTDHRTGDIETVQRALKDEFGPFDRLRSLSGSLIAFAQHGKRRQDIFSSRCIFIFFGLPGDGFTDNMFCWNRSRS